MSGEQKKDEGPAGETEREASDFSACEPRLRELDDFESVRFDESTSRPEEAWKPGVVEVELKEPVFPELTVETFSRTAGETKYPDTWSPALKQVLDNNGLIQWALSFPLSHPWSSESTESALEFYRASGRDKFVTLQFPREADVLRIASELEELPEVARAAPAPRLAPPSSPLNEPLLGNSDQPTNTVCGPDGCLENQWYIFRCRANKAWNKVTVSGDKVTGRGVIVADIDWGFNLDHQDLNSRVEFRFNTFDNHHPCSVAQGNMFDHGTAVLGLVGAGLNGSGMVGFAYEASLWAIQAGSNSSNDDSFWVSAIDLVRSKDGQGRRKVIILEIQTEEQEGNIETSIKIRKAIIDAINCGVVVCVPAGDAGRDAGIGDDGKEIPPTGSILVGAANRNNVRANSNGGCRIVVYAPGDVNHDLTCSIPGSCDYRNKFGGTSGAAPKVAGTVALMLQANDKLTQAEIRDILAQSKTLVTEPSSGQVAGVLLDAEQAVSEALRRAGTTADVRTSDESKANPSFAPPIPSGRGQRVAAVLASPLVGSDCLVLEEQEQENEHEHEQQDDEPE